MDKNQKLSKELVATCSPQYNRHCNFCGQEHKHLKDFHISEYSEFLNKERTIVLCMCPVCADKIAKGILELNVNN